MAQKHRRIAACGAIAMMIASVAAAQTPDSVARRQQRTLDSLGQELRRLQERLDSLARIRPAPAWDSAGDELAALRAAADAAARDTLPAPATQAPRLGQNALNPEITVTGDVRGAIYDPGPQTGNLFVREFEFGFQSALDPYSTAKVFLAFEEGEIDLEEGYVYWTGLPSNARLDAGRFRQSFGELNRWHLHGLPEDEYPLVLRRYAGEEGLIGTGVSLYWPLPFSGRAGAFELTVQGTVTGNEVLMAGGGRVSVAAQLLGFWQLSRSTFAQLSVSGLRGANPDTSLTTTLGALAARVSWRPPDRAARREFTLRGELWALKRDFALVAPDDFGRTRLGAYAGASLRLSRRLVVSTRADWVQSPEPGPLVIEYGLTPAITFWQSEFVYLRGAFEHLRGRGGPTSSRFTIQAVFAMGPHKHELF